MKKTMIATLIVLVALFIGFGSLNAANQQDYSMNRAEAKRNIEISRVYFDGGNLALAQVYAKKAIQANPWDKKAWANYNSIIQELAYLGAIPEFGAEIQEVEAGPSAGGAPAQLEGC